MKLGESFLNNRPHPHNPAPHEDMDGKAKHFAVYPSFYCEEGEGASDGISCSSQTLPLSNLDVNVLATALASRLQIDVCPSNPALKIIHPDRVVFIKVRLGEDKM